MKSSPADFGRLLLPMATPLDGAYLVLEQHAVCGMEWLDGDATPEAVVQRALDLGAMGIAIVRTVADGDLVGGAWERALLAETRVRGLLNRGRLHLPIDDLLLHRGLLGVAAPLQPWWSGTRPSDANTSYHWSMYD